MKNIKKIYFNRNLLNILFRDLYSHIGWSKFYNKYVLVEPIWSIIIKENIITNFICIDDLIYNFKESFGQVIAENIDNEASEYIEQAFIRENGLLFICDNPILFPYNRLKDYYDYLILHKDELCDIGGLIHYHINEKELNEEDINALRHFFTKFNEIKNQNQNLGMIISQIKLPEDINIFKNETDYLSFMLKEFTENNVSLSTKSFHTDGKIEDCIVIIQ